MVWSVTSLADWVLVSLCDWKDIHLNLDFAAIQLLTRLRILGAKIEPESLLGIELQRLELLWLKHTVIVRFIELKWLLHKGAVFDQLLQVQRGLTNHVITLEEVTVICLERELVVLPWHFDAVHQTVLEVRFAILIPIVGVGLLHILFGIEEAAEEYVRGAFPVHNLYVDSIENANTDFEVFWWLVSDVIKFVVSRIDSCGHDFDPTFDDTLLLRARWMVDLAVLHWFFWQALPLKTEIPILEINRCRTNQVITKNVIIVPNVDLKRRATRELAFKVVMLVEFWIRLVQLVVISLVVRLVIAFKVKIWVTSGSIVSRAQVKG